MTARRNHYVPRCYLNNFLTECDPPTFCVYDKEDGSVRKGAKPNDTCVENNLYVVLDPEEGEPDTIETDLLAPIDSMVAPVLRRWRSPGAEIDEADMSAMTRFLASLHVRVPRTIEMCVEISQAAIIKGREGIAGDEDRIAELVEKYNLEHPSSRPFDVAEFREMLQRPYEPPRDEQSAMLASMSIIEEVCEWLATMKWYFSAVTRSEELVTSDAPLVCIVPDGASQATFGGGFGMREAQISCAISPTVCLHMRNPENDDESVPSTRELNRRTICNADRYVVSGDYSEEIETLVKEFAFTRNQPKMDRRVLLRNFDEKAGKRREEP